MRALVVIILLATLILPFEHASASPPIDMSAADMREQAAQGVAEAQANLGLLYYDGQGCAEGLHKGAGVVRDSRGTGSRGCSKQPWSAL